MLTLSTMLNLSFFCVFAQRAMLRFSELELKEKDGGGDAEEEEEGITAAAAAAGEMGLADRQRGDDGRKGEDEGEGEEGRKTEGGGGRECCQQSEGWRGGGGGGRTPSADASEAPRGKRIYGELYRMTCTQAHTQT